jgi:HAD superfamily hydrolase (TIGR01484 family)
MFSRVRYALGMATKPVVPKNLHSLHKKAFASALSHTYKAVAFDVDGTLTHFARFIVPHFMREALVAIPERIPKAFCTGRPINHISTHLEHICSAAADPLKEKKLWTAITENGGAGYSYHPKKDTYEPFFEVPWPEKLISPDALEAFIKDKFGGHVDVAIRSHCMVTYYPKWTYLFPHLIQIVSHHIAARLRTLLKKMNLEGEILVQDSGIGNILIPKASGKGKAIKRWADYLGIDPKDILVIGDKPLPGENDEEFLNGRVGVPFTVGSLTENLLPLPVLDMRGRRLRGPKATAYLLGKVKWA